MSTHVFVYAVKILCDLFGISFLLFEQPLIILSANTNEVFRIFRGTSKNPKTPFSISLSITSWNNYSLLNDTSYHNRNRTLCHKVPHNVPPCHNTIRFPVVYNKRKHLRHFHPTHSASLLETGLFSA